MSGCSNDDNVGPSENIMVWMAEVGLSRRTEVGRVSREGADKIAGRAGCRTFGGTTRGDFGGVFALGRGACVGFFTLSCKHLLTLKKDSDVKSHHQLLIIIT